MKKMFCNNVFSMMLRWFVAGSGSRGFCRLKNDRGLALILVLSVLAIMSILGAIGLAISNSEIGISGNYRAAQQAFYAADRGTKYATGHVSAFSDSVDLYNDKDSDGTFYRLDIEAQGGGLEKNPPEGDSEHDPNKNRLNLVGEGPPPAGLGSDATRFAARYYSVSVTGVYPLDSTRPARSEVMTQVGRIVPK